MQYNYELIYRPNTDRIIKIADGLSRIPQHLMSEFRASDIDRKVTMAMRADANEKEESLIDKWEEDWEKWVKAKADKETRVEEADGNEQVEEAEERKDEKAGVDSNKELEEMEISCSEEDRWEQKWEWWLACDWYAQIVEYLKGGTKMLQNESQNRRELLRHKCKRFVLGDEIGEGIVLFWRERNGALSRCCLPEEVPTILTEIHDAHGHFASGLTLAKAVGMYYWPCRGKDIHRWTVSCDACQRVGPKKKSGAMHSILKLKPFDMVGMDFVGPITPECTATGWKYILIVVDYFSRFVLA